MVTSSKSLMIASIFTILEKYFALTPIENFLFQLYSTSILTLCKNLYFKIPFEESIEVEL